MTQIEIENNLNPIRGQVMSISRALPTGSQYFTVEAAEVDKKYNENKERISSNPTSPDLITNRGPRVIVMKSHNVITQEFTQDIDGNSVVVFNKSLGDETRAAIVSGAAVPFQTTEEAMKDSLRGETRIFADAIKTATMANVLNKNELDRLEALKAWCERCADSVRSAIASNKKKAEDYKAALAKMKDTVDLLSDGPMQVTIEDA